MVESAYLDGVHRGVDGTSAAVFRCRGNICAATESARSICCGDDDIEHVRQPARPVLWTLFARLYSQLCSSTVHDISFAETLRTAAHAHVHVKCHLHAFARTKPQQCRTSRGNTRLSWPRLLLNATHHAIKWSGSSVRRAQQSRSVGFLTCVRRNDCVSDHRCQNAELFTLTYGAMVMQLIQDFEDVGAVNKQLESM